MKKKNNIVIYIFIAAIVVLFLYVIISSFKSSKGEEIDFNIKSINLNVKVGNSVAIDYEVSDNQNIKWESDNKEIATVNNGLVNGVKLGNTVIKGTITSGDKTITRNCYVTVYSGDKNVSLNDISVPDGELFVSKGDNYKLEYDYSPTDAYITSIEYSSSDENIVVFSDGVISTKNAGEADVTITVNKNISKTIHVNVIEKKISPTFSYPIKSIDVEENEITIKPNETKDIIYTVNPKNGFIESVNWESSDSKIVTVDDGLITGKSSGEATITLTINDRIAKEIKVFVSIPVSNLSLTSNPKLVMKVGQQDTIKTSVSPVNATNTKVKYTNSNPGALTIDDKGNITAINSGKGTITVSTIDGNHQVTVSYTINPKTGILKDTADVWGYSSSIDQVPERADEAFFRTLVSKGKGTLSDGVYIYNNGQKTYKYDIKSSRLSVDSLTVLTRIYYPKNVDLSAVNTLTFCNGTGASAAGFVGVLNALDKDHSKMKTSGIIILIASTDGKSYNRKGIILATEFVKAIVDQKQGVKNAVAAYSGSGEAVGWAGSDGGYDRIVIFNSYIHNSMSATFKNKEVIFYSPNGDKLQEATQTTISSMIRYGFTNITIVSNNPVFEKYKDSALIINPGDQMGRGHGHVNIPPTGVFSYACR